MHDRVAAESEPEPAAGKRGKEATPWLGTALTQLHGFLTDPDVGVIRMAQRTLRCLASVALIMGHQHWHIACHRSTATAHQSVDAGVASAALIPAL